MSSSLLLVSIGPVQDFIASARRCQDLWFGSWLLSELSRAVAAALAAECGGESLVFPASLDASRDGKPAVANKVLVVVPPPNDARVVAEKGKEAMRGALHGVIDDAFRRLQGREFFREEDARAQLEDLMEYIWVAVPLTDDYARQRGRAEELLAARKNTRGWKQAEGKARIPKSSMDGLRESVLHEDLFDDSKTASRQRHHYFVRRGERLCGVGMLKRLGVDGGSRARRPQFHSTSHVASAPWRSGLSHRPNAKESIAKYADALRACRVNLDELSGPPAVPGAPASGPLGAILPARGLASDRDGRLLDGAVLYEGRLDDRIEQGFESREGREKARRDAASALRELRRGVGMTAPSPYYALLLADGDNMGKLIDRQDSLPAHKRLGAALDAFSISAKRIVEEAHGGSLIYSGGDDVLALLPLHTALQCAEALAEAFRMGVREFDESGGPNGTLSVGLAVAHHLVDFAEVRQQAKDAEKLAKGHEGKNALAIIVDPRSGGRLEAVGSWSGAPHLGARIATWCRLFYGEAMPDKTAFALAEAVEPLARGARPGDRELVRDAAAAAIRRALGRRRGERGGADLTAGARAAVDEQLAPLQETDPIDLVHSLTQELQIARYFLEAFEQALPPKAERLTRKTDREVTP